MPWGEASQPRPLTPEQVDRLLPPPTNPMNPSVRPFAETLAELGDTLAGIVEVCAGHRARMIAAGFSDGGADLGALHLHNEMLTKVIRR